MAPTESPTRVIPIPLHGRGERREDGRLEVAMPVEVEGRATVTRNCSDTGIAFESDRPYELGSRIEVNVEYMLDGHHYPLRCLSEVVRVDAQGTGWVIGARLQPEAPPVIDAPSSGQGAGAT